MARTGTQLQPSPASTSVASAIPVASPMPAASPIPAASSMPAASPIPAASPRPAAILRQVAQAIKARRRLTRGFPPPPRNEETTR